MKHKKTLLCSLLLISCLILVTSMPVFAAELTEAEVQQAVDAQGKETVTGNVFIWFLCAIAFLKVSQKIDSFMASLGVNVGNTGGNMMAELLIAGRGLASSFRGHGGGSHSSSHSSSPGSTKFFPFRRISRSRWKADRAFCGKCSHRIYRRTKYRKCTLSVFP